MYPYLLMTHSILRYLILIFFVYITVVSLRGWVQKGPFTKDEALVQRLLASFTHLQLLLGIMLYFLSPWVVFSSESMRTASNRYWTVEHWILNILAIVLVTIASLRIKKLPAAVQKHRSLFILNSSAFLIILVSLWLSQRGIL